MDGVRAADGGDGRLREAEVPNLSRLHEIRHRLDRVFDRRRGIDAMLIVEIDRLDAEPREAGVARGAHILRLAADAEPAAVLAAENSELRRDDDSLSPSFQRLRDELFVPADAVHVRGVEKRDAELEGALERRER